MVDVKKNISDVREKTHEGVDNVMDKADDVRKNGKERLTHLKEKAIIARKNIDSYIQKNPEKSVLMATGVGLALGAIIATAIAKRKK